MWQAATKFIFLRKFLLLALKHGVHGKAFEVGGCLLRGKEVTYPRKSVFVYWERSRR